MGRVPRKHSDAPSDLLLPVTPVRAAEDVHHVVGRIQERAQRILDTELHLEAKATMGFAMTLSEACQNVIEHAGTGGWVAVQSYTWRKRLAGRKVVVIAVSDGGIGFRRSLEATEARKVGERWGDGAALELAILHSVSRFRESGRGQGLSGIRRYLGRWQGKLSIRSGTARFSVVPDWDDDVPLAERLPWFPGSQVQITIPAQEADPRARGDFQHRILERFHRDLETAGKRWRDVSPAEARELVARIGEELLPTHRDGLFLADDGKRFVGRVLIAATQKVVETLVAWMPQYDFDPSRVEVTFGLDEQGLPPWRIELAGGHGLVLRGRIDRIDLCRPEGIRQILAVVIDYKSRSRSLDTVKLQNGLELQLLSYLGAIQHLADGAGTPRMPELVPAGVFYVGLNLKRDSVRTRTDARANSGKAIRRGFQHSGRFNARYLGHLDNRDEPKGDQFRYAINNNGSFAKGRTDALDAAAFQRLLSDLETHLRRIGEAIFDGDASVAPYRKRSETACDFCAFRSVCRFDPWAQPYRVLRPAQGPAEAHEPADWREAP